MKPDRFEIMPFGLSISFKLHTKDYNKKIHKANLLELKKVIIAASGPITNLLIIFLINIIDVDFIKKDIAIYSNLLIMFFNLMPIYPLDGGRILKGIIHILIGGKMSNIIINRISNFVMIIITAIASIGVFYFENISIFLIIMFMWGLVIKENKRYKIISNLYNSIYSRRN